MNGLRRGGGLALVILLAVGGAAAPALAKPFRLPHLKPHESKPKVARIDEVTLAVTADEPGANQRAIRAAAQTTLAEGYDEFEVVSDQDANPISFVGQARRTLTIFVKMSHARAAGGRAANRYDAREVMSRPAN